MEEIKSIKDIPSENLVTGGHALCAGCGPSIGLRLTLLALGQKTIIVNAAGCFTLQPTYPYTPFKVPWLFLAIENAGAAVTGIFHALKSVKKEKDVNIVAYVGDGALYDIGLQSMSNTLERGDNVFFICYNNQNFANTGHQMDSATPKFAYTTTTPSGNPFFRKPLPKIVAAHGIPYVATATVGFTLDYMNKLKKAKEMEGPKFIDLLGPCVPGWGYDSAQTIKISKLAVETGAWPLYEIVNGKFRLTYKPKKLKPVKEYLKMQKRFAHLKEKEINQIQKIINEEWNKLTKGDYWGSKEY